MPKTSTHNRPAKPATLPRLLPRDAYPAEMNQRARDLLDMRLRNEFHLVPTEPGHYHDPKGHCWQLNPGGNWTDMRGITKHQAYNPMMVLSLPLSRFEQTAQDGNG